MSTIRSSKTIKVTYNINPPSSVSAPADLPRRVDHSYAVTNPATNTVKAFYQELGKSLTAVRNEVGGELTVWRDVVGKAELNKEPKKGEDNDEEVEE